MKINLVLVQGSSILELVEIAMSAFDSHGLQASKHLATLFTEHADTTCVHAYLDTAISIQAYFAIRCTSLL